MAHIEDIAARTTPRKPQVWRLAGRTGGGQHPDQFLDKLAKKAAFDPLDLRKEAMPSTAVLQSDPLS